MECLQHALDGKGIYEPHVKDFQRKLTSGYFTTLREKEEEINQKLS